MRAREHNTYIHLSSSAVSVNGRVRCHHVWKCAEGTWGTLPLSAYWNWTQTSISEQTFVIPTSDGGGRCRSQAHGPTPPCIYGRFNDGTRNIHPVVLFTARSCFNYLLSLFYELGKWGVYARVCTRRAGRWANAAADTSAWLMDTPSLDTAIITAAQEQCGRTLSQQTPLGFLTVWVLFSVLSTHKNPASGPTVLARIVNNKAGDAPGSRWLRT